MSLTTMATGAVDPVLKKYPELGRNIMGLLSVFKAADPIIKERKRQIAAEIQGRAEPNAEILDSLADDWNNPWSECSTAPVAMHVCMPAANSEKFVLRASAFEFKPLALPKPPKPPREFMPPLGKYVLQRMAHPNGSTKFMQILQFSNDIRWARHNHFGHAWLPMKCECHREAAIFNPAIRHLVVTNPGFRLDEAKAMFPREQWPDPPNMDTVTDDEILVALASGTFGDLAICRKITIDQLEKVARGPEPEANSEAYTEAEIEEYDAQHIIKTIGWADVETWTRLTRNRHIPIEDILYTLHAAPYPFNWDVRELCQRPDLTDAHAQHLINDILLPYWESLGESYYASIHGEGGLFEDIKAILSEHPGISSKEWGLPLFYGKATADFVQHFIALETKDEWPADAQLPGLENCPHINMRSLMSLACTRTHRDLNWQNVALNMLEFHPSIQRKNMQAAATAP